MEDIFKYKELYDKYDNIFLLEQKTMCLEDINIIGTTSWGNFQEGHIEDRHQNNAAYKGG